MTGVLRTTRTIALLLVVVALGVSAANAAPVTYSTSGTFTCAGCAGSGTNSVTFLGGMGNALMITFTGLGSTSLNTPTDSELRQLSNVFLRQRHHQRFRHLHSHHYADRPACRKRQLFGDLHRRLHREQFRFGNRQFHRGLGDDRWNSVLRCLLSQLGSPGLQQWDSHGGGGSWRQRGHHHPDQHSDQHITYHSPKRTNTFSLPPIRRRTLPRYANSTPPPLQHSSPSHQYADEHVDLDEPPRRHRRTRRRPTPTPIVVPAPEIPTLSGRGSVFLVLLLGGLAVLLLVRARR